ncbi:HNH endonuclease [Methylocella tundrae]|nr:HNH endonuclease signature motif containing protein [Methylocella tundrae]
MIKPLRISKQRAIAAIPPKRADPYYLSAQWKEDRASVLDRDGHMCTVPGCGKQARVVDHGRARRWGGSDKKENLRSLCDDHDREFKERPDGSRKGIVEGRGFEKCDSRP